MTSTALTAIDKEISGVIKRARVPWPTPKLFVIELPIGHTEGFSIDFNGDHLKRYQSSEWLSKGFDGVLFRGAGEWLTTIVAPSGYHDATVFIGPHNGIVAFEDCAVLIAKRKGIHAGLERATRYTKFCIRTRRFHFKSPSPDAQGIRSVWGLFTYNCDTDLEDTTFDGADLNEHDSYSHGYASRGSRWVRVKVEGSGAENDKHATRPFEANFTPNAIVYRADCTYQNWNQPWSWRGGAGLVVQGAAADVVLERCVFYGGKDASHCRCVMIDDGQPGVEGHYGMDGVPGRFPANGWIILNDCGVSGSGTLGTSSPIVRVGTVYAATQATARGFLMENSGAYGKLAVMQLGNIPAGKTIIRGCNTAQIRDTCAAAGMDIANEVNVPTRDHLIPVSFGYGA